METQNPIRVLVVDDHGMVRRGIVTYLKSNADIQVVGEAENGREAIELCEQFAPNVVLMDVTMPEMDGVTATRAIKQKQPQIQIIVLTSFPEKALVQDALQAGAISYLLKNVSGEDLAAAIRAAAAGRSTLAQEAIQALVQPQAPAEPASAPALTAREREVLALLVKGLNNNEIAERLVVSHATAKAHVSNILSKLGVSNRAEAVAAAIQQKLVSN
ncbi:MAG: response regulator transcription factor [Chloroflexi bacterium]|nr:response regulator transcription factor [Chloroflexota bacterium]